jgi:hypothetical protein
VRLIVGGDFIGMIMRFGLGGGAVTIIVMIIAACLAGLRSRTPTRAGLGTVEVNLFRGFDGCLGFAGSEPLTDGGLEAESHCGHVILEVDSFGMAFVEDRLGINAKVFCKLVYTSGGQALCSLRRSGRRWGIVMRGMVGPR